MCGLIQKAGDIHPFLLPADFAQLFMCAGQSLVLKKMGHPLRRND